MSKVNQTIGQDFNHDQLKRVTVIEAEENSRTKVTVKVIDRGAGFSDKYQRFVGVKSSSQDADGNKVSNWSRSENREFGSLHSVHINELKS